MCKINCKRYAVQLCDNLLSKTEWCVQPFGGVHGGKAIGTKKELQSILIVHLVNMDHFGLCQRYVIASCQHDVATKSGNILENIFGHGIISIIEEEQPAGSLLKPHSNQLNNLLL